MIVRPAACSALLHLDVSFRLVVSPRLKRSPFLSSLLLQDTPTALSDTASSAAVGSRQQRSHTCMLYKPRTCDGETLHTRV